MERPNYSQEQLTQLTNAYQMAAYNYAAQAPAKEKEEQKDGLQAGPAPQA